MSQVTFSREDRKEIYDEYMEEIDRIADNLEDKSHFHPHEIIDILLNIVEKRLNQ